MHAQLHARVDACVRVSVLVCACREYMRLRVRALKKVVLGSTDTHYVQQILSNSTRLPGAWVTTKSGVSTVHDLACRLCFMNMSGLRSVLVTELSGYRTKLLGSLHTVIKDEKVTPLGRLHAEGVVLHRAVNVPGTTKLSDADNLRGSAVAGRPI